MKLGNLIFSQIAENYNLVAPPIKELLQNNKLSEMIFVSEIDPELADTVSFCDKYEISLGIATNCLIVEAKRSDRTWYAACLVLATDKADINGAIRKQLDARKISFAPMDIALGLTKMEYGGITPIGLPVDWPILVDEAIMNNKTVVVGGGIRGSKLAVDTRLFKELPNSIILDITKPT